MQLVMRLDPARFDRTICATRSVEAPVVKEAQAAGVSVLCLNRRSRVSIQAWWSLASFLRGEEIDVLHAHKYGSNVWGSVIGRLAGVPVVVAQEHTWSYEGDPLRRLLDRHVVARGADVFLAVSREDRRRMTEVEGIDPNLTRLVHNGIPPLRLPTGRDIRGELGIARDAPVVGVIASLRPQKALDVLVRATTLLAPQFQDLTVLIAGDGSERERLESLIEATRLERSIMLLGPRGDIPDILSILDVAVSSSDFEGSPLAIMEYMAAGKPVVATRVGGVPDLVEHGKHGLLVEPRDPRDLAGAIAELLRDPERRAAMGALGRERQRREFDIDGTVRRLETLYEQLYLASDRRRARI
jgi:glycosyltransferase involved in cell wall biosynthesis